MLYFSRWKIISILMVVLAGLSYAAPNLLSKETLDKFPSWLPNQQMTLGLDLQGGSHVLLQVDKPAMLVERKEVLRDEARAILREDKIGYRFSNVSGVDGLDIRLRDVAQKDLAIEKLDILLQPVTSGVFGAGIITEVDLTQPEDDLLRLTLNQAGIDNAISTAVTQSIEVIRKRIDELGTTEPVVQRQGTDRILVQVPGLDDPQRLKDLIGQTAKLTFHLVSQEGDANQVASGQARAPIGTKLLYEQSDDPDNAIPVLVQTRILVDGEDLTDAQSGFDQRTNESIVSFRFNTKGATRFGQVTTANVNRPFAIVLDDVVLSAPVIREPILGGSGQISGSFDVDSANNLAILLRAGALPAKLDIVEERTVGPGLGADSIESGRIASIVGAVAVLIFMVMAYGLLGVIANVALIANIAMLIGILSLLGATLTLPGIAGIVLTMGMAVDSNVLIYERIREERRNGRNLIQSFDAGFRTAFGTILDANVTTFIAATILFALGSGPIKGFAVTLAVGIITTVFTAYTFTRMMVALWVRYKKPKELPARPIKLIKDVTDIKFMKQRRFSFPFSAVGIVMSVILFFAVSLNFGIDFKGGTLVEIQSKEISQEVDVNGNALKVPADIEDIRARLGELNLGDVQVQEFGAPSDVLIRVEAQDIAEGEGANSAGDKSVQTAVRLVTDALSSDYDMRRAEVVGPTVSGELAITGTIAIIAALLAIMVYIWFRFEWQFALGAVAATFHDVLFTILLFAIFRIEFSLSSIAAILTIVGYSLNDTVVVYDRIRENLR
ncbi:MAG: protein translocase subunit SecD, partial [Nitratireductor sp.]